MGNANDLWVKFLDGDIKAWEQIFHNHYKDLYGYGLTLSNQTELTKDCIHELFVTIWERKEHLSQVNSVKAYLLVSLRRSLMKKMERQRKYYKDVEDFTDYSYKKHCSPEVTIVKSEMETEKIEALYEAISNLSNREKEVLYLKYFNGLTYDEIEEILPIKYQSIKNHVYRAIQDLRKIMREELTKIAISIGPLLTWIIDKEIW